MIQILLTRIGRWLTKSAWPALRSLGLWLWENMVFVAVLLLILLLVSMRQCSRNDRRADQAQTQLSQAQQTISRLRADSTRLQTDIQTAKQAPEQIRYEIARKVDSTYRAVRGQSPVDQQRAVRSLLSGLDLL
ncbi:hypothetical protein [Fibrisoma montanum]|uniref:hypothetical protein n=1 Tax=Fibrisoma montanum TaxID=2305895 RepID=UPI0011C21E68|nr:hypothetical protein [Fibrisoma montanum]